MLARGPAVIPSDGLGMVAEWTTAAIRQAGGMVELGVRAAALEPDAQGRRVEAVLMEDGRRLSARQVVLAVEAPAAREFLTRLDPASAGRIPTEAASSVGAAFELRTPLYRGRTILLNADPGSGERPGSTSCARPPTSRGPGGGGSDIRRMCGPSITPGRVTLVVWHRR